MKIWVDGSWYELPHKILIVYLEDKDKKNIKNMHSDCNLYCEYDESEFKTEYIKELLIKLKKDIGDN